MRTTPSYLLTRKLMQLWSIVDDWRHTSKASGAGVPTAVAAKPRKDRTDLVQLQSQLGEAKATQRDEPQSLLSCC